MSRTVALGPLFFILLGTLANGQENLIFQDEFDELDTSIWQHLITAWRGGNGEFEYYSNRPENR